MRHTYDRCERDRWMLGESHAAPPWIQRCLPTSEGKFITPTRPGRASLLPLPGGKCSSPENLSALHAEERLVLPVLRGGPEDAAPEEINLKDPAKIFEIANAEVTSSRWRIGSQLRTRSRWGRGSIWLDLTSEQYEKLRKG